MLSSNRLKWQPEVSNTLGRRALRLLISLAGVALLTYAGYRLFPVNATTQGFAYLLLVLIVASIWGFFEAAVASVAATLTFNFFFFEPVGTFTIADPRNWIALYIRVAQIEMVGAAGLEPATSCV